MNNTCREFEQQRELTEKGVQRVTNQINHYTGIGKGTFSEETQINQTDKVFFSTLCILHNSLKYNFVKR